MLVQARAKIDDGYQLQPVICLDLSTGVQVGLSTSAMEVKLRFLRLGLRGWNLCFVGGLESF